VPHPPDESDANTLPDPELNPLLNPLLAAHMGRWAEVYFTNPPEKRGQAISALLRELESISPPESASVPVIRDKSARRKTETADAPHSLPAAMEAALSCGGCGYDNSAEQRFCGMCGAPLQKLPEVHALQVADAVPTAGASGSKPKASAGGNSVAHGIEPGASYTEPGRYRSRLYIGAGLAILLAVLGYRAWRGAQAPASAPAPHSALSRIPAQSAPANSAPQASAMGSLVPRDNPPVSPVRNQPDANLLRDQVAHTQPAPQIVPVAVNSSAMAVPQSGAEELATAEKYLKGNPGDSREAAQWLWKAVGKGNLAATMALSDLYLRGDGVPKSCDQARLLLDAAARRGGTAATERLGNLQAFGCE